MHTAKSRQTKIHFLVSLLFVAELDLLFKHSVSGLYGKQADTQNVC